MSLSTFRLFRGRTPLRPALPRPGARAWRAWLVLFGIAMALGAQGPGISRAATVLALDLPALVQRADVIALGHAEDQRGRWRSDHKAIVTDVDFVVHRALKGRAGTGTRLRITHLGGEVDDSDVALTVPGEASFVSGQTVLVFLRRAAGELRVVGMAQGVMPVTGAGPDATVAPNPGQPALMRPSADGAMKAVPHDQVPPPRALADILDQIAQLVAGAGR